MKALEVRGRPGEHGGSHSMIAVKNGQRTSIVHSNQQYRWIHQADLDRIGDSVKLAKELVVWRLLQFETQALDHVREIETTYGNATTLRQGEHSEAGLLVPFELHV